jgi:hypothetical protein
VTLRITIGRADHQMATEQVQIDAWTASRA